MIDLTAFQLQSFSLFYGPTTRASGTFSRKRLKEKKNGEGENSSYIKCVPIRKYFQGNRENGVIRFFLK